MPLRIGQRKVLTRRKRSRSAPAILVSPTKPSKRRKQWSDVQMEAAIEAVQTGQSGINCAARDHGVPPTTLKDRISGRVQNNTKPGPAKYLSDKEESELSTFLKDCAAVGYGKTRREVMRIAELQAKRKGVLRKERISSGWWRQFSSRQGDLSLRRGDNTAHIRMDAINSETMDHYFDLLKSTLTDHDLMNAPAQVYNVDESGMPLDPKAPNVVAKTGTKKVRYRATGRKGQITIVACASAAGQILPPTIIFEAKKVNHAWTHGELPGTTYGCSDKGWITSDLFESWLSEHFLKHAVSARPVLLLLDGHSTHNQPEVIRLARDKEVIIFCLPPHATHEAQPLDCGVFSPLKAQWRQVAHTFLQSNPGKIITKFNFNSLFADAWLRAVTPANVMGGFKTCGVYPFNPAAIMVPETENSNASSGEINASGSTDTSTATDRGSGVSEDNTGSQVLLPPLPFSEEQEALFAKRFEEGYDIYIDTDYIRWIELNHPEVNISSLIENSTATTTMVDDDMNTNLPYAEPTINHTVSLPMSQPCDDLSTNKKTPNEPSSTETRTSDGQTKDAITVIPRISTPSLSDILVSPGVTTPATSKRTSPRARLLTSDESLALLEEKQKKKEMELMEKEKRKTEREEKKREKEETLKKKQEEKAKKAEEKAKKAEEKAKKAGEKTKRQAKAPAKGRKKNDSLAMATDPVGPSTGMATDSAGPSTESMTNTINDENIDSNVCCMCFVHYEDDVLEGSGMDWIACKCGRWLHEDCIEDVVKDNAGDERYCSFCVDKFTI